MNATTTILVVDDDPGMLAVASEELLSKGYAVTEAGNGLEALSALDAQGFDLIISDLEMPRMNGLELVREIRSRDNDRISQIPIVMLTGRGDDKAIQAAFDCGASAFVQKPVNWLTLMHQLNFILRAGEAEGALREAHKESEKAAAARKDLMTNLRHELRTPLHVITGYADVLKGSSESLSDDLSEAVDFMRSSAGDINARLVKIFLLSDLIGGDVELNARPSSFREMFTGVVNGLGNKANFDIDGLQIDLPADLTVELDHKLFMVATENLVENALNFGQGRVLISSRQLPNGKTVIEIEDDGQGFADGMEQNFVEAFSQGDSGLTRVSTGLGLGLTTANMIIELLGGSLELGQSEELSGARVQITF